MLLISLTGGIGAGKSTAASLLRQRGAHILELDEVARTILDPGTSATWEVGQAWPSVVHDGVVDRAELAAIVFRDPAELAKLNAITHPRTWLAAERLLERWNSEDPAGVAIIEIAILATSPRRYSSHLNVVVGADLDVRIRRLSGRGLSEADARSRIAHQRPQAELLGLADAWLDNSGDVNELAGQISRLWEARIAPYAGNLAAAVRRAGSDRLADPAELGRCAARLAYHGVEVEAGPASGELVRAHPLSSELPEAEERRVLAAAGFVPSEACFQLADPEYQVRLI